MDSTENSAIIPKFLACNTIVSKIKEDNLKNDSLEYKPKVKRMKKDHLVIKEEGDKELKNETDVSETSEHIKGENGLLDSKPKVEFKQEPLDIKEELKDGIAMLETIFVKKEPFDIKEEGNKEFRNGMAVLEDLDTELLEPKPKGGIKREFGKVIIL